MTLLCCSFSLKHPFYLSVTEYKYSPAEKTVQGAVKMFTNDLEDALKKTSQQKVDLINGKDKEALNKILGDYLRKHLVLKLDGKQKDFELLGFEREEEAVWTYIEYKNCAVPKKATVENSLLYDYLPGQTNIVSFELNGKKQNSKVTNPEKQISFDF